LKPYARTAALAAILACGAAFAQPADTYPSRPIRYVVASAPGGIADITARVLGPRLAEALHQPVVIENRTAGGILVGVELVARAPADGYTLLSATPQVAIAQSMYKRATVDPRRELAPVALVGTIPNVLVVNPKTKARTVQELVELARANPGKLNYSSTGAGTSVHLSAELLKYQAKVDIVHVPYRGAAAAMTALIAGDVDMLVDSLPPSLPHIRAGRVRALAVTTATRVPQLPEVPTMIEAGFPGFEVSAWSGVVTTAGTPPEIIARLEAEVRRALEDPQTAATYEKAGLPVHYLDARDFGAFWDREIEKFAVAVKFAGAAVE
jgi:tripartite-type tricarboxylate transporter receptor subunit TctC